MATNDYAITNTLLQSLFGPSPEQQAQEYKKAREVQALNVANLGSEGAVLYAGSKLAQDLGQSAQQLGGAVRRGVFGIETPKEIEDNVANQIKAKAQPLLQQGDMAAYADFLAQEYSKAGLNDRALRARTAAEQFKSQAAERGANIAFKEAQAEQMRAKANVKPKLLEIDAGDRIELRDPETYEVVKTIQKGLSPAQKAKAAGEAEDKVGPVGKTGAYKNVFGDIIPGTEISKQRVGFLKAETLLSKLNAIDYDTVQKAEANFDYTEPGVTKTIGSRVFGSTVQAQTKIAAAQLLEQIEKLPPGSASDADMRASLRDFPGYGNAKNLADWVDRTKAQLAQSLARQTELYGFKQTVQPTAPISPKKGQSKAEEKPAAQGEWKLLNN